MVSWSPARGKSGRAHKQEHMYMCMYMYMYMYAHSVQSLSRNSIGRVSLFGGTTGDGEGRAITVKSESNLVVHL